MNVNYVAFICCLVCAGICDPVASVFIERKRIDLAAVCGFMQLFAIVFAIAFFIAGVRS